MDAPTVALQGYRFSVYTRIVRLVLEEKGVAYRRVEVNPFVAAAAPSLHPFGRVPVLVHGGFALYETGAIARYIDAAFPGPPLVPQALRSLARMAQVTAIVDNYGYWPLVRQVFSHRVFRPLAGEPFREDEIAAGLRAAVPVLAALEDIAAEALVLDGRAVTLADCHLAPMLDYFAAAPEGAAMLGGCAALSAWWEAARVRPAFLRTDPGRPGGAGRDEGPG